MPITRCSEQSRCSLEEFYREIFANKKYDPTGVGNAMLQLVECINDLFKQTQLWGLTSHAKLILQNADDSASKWYVTISCYGQDLYRIDYLLPTDKRPWPYAQVTGEARSLSEAIGYILIAMRESEGWAGNKELSKLLSDKKLG